MDGINDLLQVGDYLTAKPTGTAVSGDVLSGKTFANSSNLKNTGTMVNNGSKTFTPAVSDQTLTPGYYSGGTIKGDSNLVSSNILNGISIFGVAGSSVPLSSVLAAGSTVFSYDYGGYSTLSSSMTKVGKRYTMNFAGSIRIQYAGFSAMTTSFQVYKNGAPIGTLNTGGSSSGQLFPSRDFTCNAGDYFDFYTSAYSPSYPSSIGRISISIANSPISIT